MREGSLEELEDEWEFEAPQFCDFAIDQLLDADPHNFALFGNLDWVVTPQKADHWFQQYHWLHESKEKQQELQVQQPLKHKIITQPTFVESPVLPSKQNSTPPIQPLTSNTTTTFSSPKSTTYDNDFTNTPRRRATRVPVPTSIPVSLPQDNNNQPKTVSIAQLQKQFEGRRNSLENLLNGFVITKPVIDEDSEPDEPTSDLDNSSLSDYNDRYNQRISDESLSDLLDSDDEQVLQPTRNHTSQPSKIMSVTGHTNDVPKQQHELFPQKKNKKPAPVDVDDVVNDLLQDLDLHLEKVTSHAEESDSDQAHPPGSLSPRGKNRRKPVDYDPEDSYFVVHNQNKKEPAALKKKEPTIKLRKPKGSALSNISNQSGDTSKPEWKRDFSEIARIYKTATQVPSSINLMSTQNPQISFCPAPQKKKGGKVKKTIASVKTTKESSPQQSSVDVGAIEAEVAKMLAEHNKKFKPKSTYEPRKYGVKEIRMWEAESGKKWLECTAAEREEANEWISSHI